MPAREEIQESLTRKLKPGKEYDKLIPSATCENTSLGSGDTFHTVSQIQDWVLKHFWQMQKVAPLLVGSTLAETVNNIYQFERDHIQYKLGGATQYIHSPACAWKVRKSGIDCKSFSVLSSAILTCLGIKHYIRQIKQPHFQPNEFSHVYVVVPVDQNIKSYQKNAATLVLDGTKPYNIESSYTHFEDIPMMLEHIGLNAPAPNEAAQEIMNNFETFCDLLLGKGISLETVNAIRAEVNRYTSQGNNPYVVISQQSIRIGDKIFLLKTNGLNGEFWDGLVDQGTQAAQDEGKSFLEDLDWEDISGVFSDLFGSCSSEREDGARRTEKDAQAILENTGLISQTLSISAINKFVEMTTAYIQRRKRVARKTSGCNRDNHTTGYQVMLKFQQEVMSALNAQLQQIGWTLQETTRLPHTAITNINLPLVSGGFGGGGSTVIKPSVLDPYTYPQYTLINSSTGASSSTVNMTINVETQDTTGTTGNTNTGSSGTTGTTGTTGIEINTGSNPKVPSATLPDKKSSLGTTLLWGTGIAAAGIFFWPKIQSTFSQPVPQQPVKPVTKKAKK